MTLHVLAKIRGNSELVKKELTLPAWELYMYICSVVRSVYIHMYNTHIHIFTYTCINT